MLAIRLDIFCFPPAPAPPPCPPLELPPPPTLDFAELFGRSLLAPLTLPDDEGADDRRPDLDDDSRRSPRLLVDTAELPPRRPSPLPLPAGTADGRGPRKELSLPSLPLACLSLAGVVVECLSLAVPRGRGGARPPTPVALPVRDEARGLAGVVPETPLEDRRDLAGVVTSWLGCPMSPSDPELE